MAYFLQKLNPTKCNYKIYNKELLAIVSAFEHQRPKLEGTNLPIQVLTNHKALEYFITTKKLTCKQAQQALTLVDYNFQITYHLGTKNMKANALTYKLGDRLENATNERQKYQFQTLIQPNRIHLDLQAQLEDVVEVEETELITLAPLLDREIDKDKSLEFLKDQVQAAQP